MGGFGMGEVILILMVALVAAGFVLSTGIGKPIGRRKGNQEFERRVLDELEAIHLRLDLITQRLDRAGIPAPRDERSLPGDSAPGADREWEGRAG